MNNLPITHFSIQGLHGDTDINIPFKQPYKIFVSENGVGKTTVLTCLYAVLTCQFSKVNHIDFDEIIVHFSDDNKVIIDKKTLQQAYHIKTDTNKTLQAFIPNNFSSLIKEIQQKIPQAAFENLIELGYMHSLENLKKQALIKEVSQIANIPTLLLANIFKTSANHVGSKLGKLITQIKQHFDLEVLYLPTYRRIEENLYKLGYIKGSLILPNELLKSGMLDIQEKWTQINKENRVQYENFIKICNEYLFEKDLYLDEKKSSIQIITNKNKILSLENLSSGEKQIISIFSQLYLASDKPCIVLFDEPELSISIEWQRKLLPDIIAAPRCQFLLAATHSPLIVDNEMIRYTVSLGEYIDK